MTRYCVHESDPYQRVIREILQAQGAQPLFLERGQHCLPSDLAVVSEHPEFTSDGVRYVLGSDPSIAAWANTANAKLVLAAPQLERQDERFLEALRARLGTSSALSASATRSRAW